jgi:NADH-quinone oxidoreductase subunit J
MTAELFFFYGFAGLAVISALGMVWNLHNTVAAALSLVVTMVSLAGIYVLLHAHLVAVVQIMVYAGAILVLFIFVVMLLNLREDALPPARLRPLKLIGVLLGAVGLAVFVGGLTGHLPDVQPIAADFGGYRSLGRALFTDYVLAFELISLLLLAAIVGAVVLAKRRLGP